MRSDPDPAFLEGRIRTRSKSTRIRNPGYNHVVKITTAEAHLDFNQRCGSGQNNYGIRNRPFTNNRIQI